MRRLVIRNRKAFTLIELMFAVAITLLVVTGASLSFVQLMFLADFSVNLTIAATDAQYILEQLKGLAYGDISSYTAPVFNNLPQEAITLTRSVGASLADITVAVSWQERNQARNFSLSTYIAK